MKICILSTGRAGSTSLYNLLKKHLPSNYYCCLEPFNPGMDKHVDVNVNQKLVIESEENVLIKTLIGQTQKNVDLEDTHVWLFENFDKIILLDRLDKQLQLESFSYQSFNNGNWHEKKRYRMEMVPKDIIDTNIKRLEHSTNKINELSKRYNKKIYYYEDIFLDNNIETINEIFNLINETPNEELLNFWVISDKKRVRVKDDEKKLL
jgi:hypothetical protein